MKKRKLRQKSTRLSERRTRKVAKYRRLLVKRTGYRSTAFPIRRVYSEERIDVPAIMSMINAPEQMIFFFNYADRQAMEHTHLLFDFSNVKAMTSDAIVVFIAHLHRIWENGVVSRALLPGDSALILKMYDSGFFNYMKVSGLQPPPTTNSIAIGNVQKEVVDEAVVQIAKWAIQKCFGNSRDGDEALTNAVGQTLAETMYNTVDHADVKGRKIQYWTVNAHYDSTTSRVCISFVDLGVGILKSIRPALQKQIVSALFRYVSAPNLSA